MEQSRFTYLYERFQQGALSAAEYQEFAGLLQQTDDPALLQEVVAMVEEAAVHPVHEPLSHTDKAFRLIVQIDKTQQLARKDTRPVHRVHFLRTAWFRYVAAAVLLFVVCSLWFVVGRRGPEQPEIVQTPIDITPGHDGAILTLADGKTIVLDSLGNGIIAKQNGSEVELSDGKLTYAATHSPLTTDHSPAYNTLQTPRGRQFQLRLPDGTKVWLNAASSISYPTAFVGNQRKVKISGEGYFEVSKNKEKPFIVDVAGKQTVEVLGTHFNINSYADEDAIRTTLLEGLVRVTRNSEHVMLKPGEQAIAAAAHSPLTIDHSPMIDQIMSWKNGLFNFNGADVRTVMRQLERWYDIDVKYEGNVPDISFQGELDRRVSFADMLEILPVLGIKYRLEGRSLIVSK